MKAVAVYPLSQDLRLIDVPEPHIDSDTGVKLAVLDVGICGTDREICAFEYGNPPPGSDYLIIGHECLAQVVEVGRRVQRVQVGDLVVPMVRRPCPHQHCRACVDGKQDFCFTGEFRERGIKDAHGFMTELIVEEERYLNPVPSSLREVAVLVEPLTIAEKALIQIWHLQERLPWGCPHRPGKSHGHCRRAVVLGAGPVGLLGAMAFRLHDFETIVYSREAKPNPKASIAEAIGATYVSAEEVAPGQLAQRFGAIDCVYEAAGASRIGFETMESLGANSVFVFTGVPGRKAPIEVDTDLWMRNLVLRNQIVLGTVNAGQDGFENAITDLGAFMDRWPDAVRALISGRHSLEASHDLLVGRASGIKRVLSVS